MNYLLEGPQLAAACCEETAPRLLLARYDFAASDASDTPYRCAS